MSLPRLLWTDGEYRAVLIEDKSRQAGDFDSMGERGQRVVFEYLDRDMLGNTRWEKRGETLDPMHVRLLGAVLAGRL